MFVWLIFLFVRLSAICDMAESARRVFAVGRNVPAMGTEVGLPLHSEAAHQLVLDRMVLGAEERLTAPRRNRHQLLRYKLS